MDVDDLQPIRLQQRDSGQVSRGTSEHARDNAISDHKIICIE